MCLTSMAVALLALAGGAGTVSAASVAMSVFDQIARINALGGSVTATTGVNVSMPGRAFLMAATAITDAPPTQFGPDGTAGATAVSR